METKELSRQCIASIYQSFKEQLSSWFMYKYT